MPAPAELTTDGFVCVGGFETPEDAFAAARVLVKACWAEPRERVLVVIGDFVVPPEDGTPSRDFQTLHFDFGLPIDPRVAHDVARYTALHVPLSVLASSAVTRLVALASLFGQRRWPTETVLLDRLCAYGRTHGAWDDALGYTEGSLARLVEAAAGTAPRLPSVKADPGFLCGLEFDALGAELAFFERHGLRVQDVEVEVEIHPGELLVFDNLTLTHGRRGTRKPGELRQRMFGYPRLDPAAQRELRDEVLAAFQAAPNHAPMAPAT